MIRMLLFFSVSVLSIKSLVAQTVKQKLQAAYQQFEQDDQLKQAISSLYVINAKTGEVVFDKNSQVGLAPASTQKIITACTAFELLGKDYRYKTDFGFLTVAPGVTDFYIKSSGDPTLGSWRYTSTKADTIINNFYAKLLKENYQGKINLLVVNNLNFETKNIPGGWIWDDVGNYYGAGAGGLNWRENQYDLALKSPDSMGEKVKLLAFNGKNKFDEPFISEVKSAGRGSGDNAYIFLPIGNTSYIVRGTIPIAQDSFVISGAIRDPVQYFAKDFGDLLLKNKKITEKLIAAELTQELPRGEKIFYTQYSPKLDSIIYWFLERSINLYGEALMKTFAFQKNGYGSTDSGLAITKRFWREKGIYPGELNMYDGSGLSPQNRVTTHAQVEILKYAKQQSWFPYFFGSFPEFNKMKMKSGTISDVKAYCGYHTSGDGTEYIFSFIVNNYVGGAPSVVTKMYKVLDALK